jgi:3-oxoacyl-(acyl-carrier-protein) synthase
VKTPIAITAIASLSSLGNDSQEIWDAYRNSKTYIHRQNGDDTGAWVAALPQHLKDKIRELQDSDSKYKSLDDTVLFALLTARQAVAQAGWTSAVNFGVNVGSSRGATALFEKQHEYFLQTGKAQTLASPTTTMGNISSWIAHDLQTNGPDISHSITCSTALHAVLNGVAWLRSGMANKFLVGGSEAPLTPFTIAQMQALKIYATTEGDYPCRAFDFTKTRNTMVLGEGAGMLCLEVGKHDNALAYIEGVGYATEVLQHNISISSDAVCFQKSMKMALGETDPTAVDAIVMHAPGTIKGDESEYLAIQKVFGAQVPLLTTNKWKIGHTFGASGVLSLEMALLMMQHQQFIGVPFGEASTVDKPIKKVLVNAVGFGGNAVSILVSL